MVERGGCLTGYATAIGFFGHAVGETTADLQALIGAAPLSLDRGSSYRRGMQISCAGACERGLRIVQPMTLMTLGPYKEPQGAFLPSILY